MVSRGLDKAVALCYAMKQQRRRVSPNIMARYREYLEEQRKKGIRPKTSPVGSPEAREDTERRALLDSHQQH